jgi:hypothetical protein
MYDSDLAEKTPSSDSIVNDPISPRLTVGVVQAVEAGKRIPNRIYAKSATSPPPLDRNNQRLC